MMLYFTATIVFDQPGNHYGGLSFNFSVPAKPTLSMLSRNQTQVNVTWYNWNTDKNKPASIYYIVYRKNGTCH